MANMDEIYDALRTANANGDKASVEKLSDYINSQPSVSQAAPSAAAPKAAPSWTEAIMSAPVGAMNEISDLVTGTGKFIASLPEDPLGYKIGRGLKDVAQAYAGSPTSQQANEFSNKLFGTHQTINPEYVKKGDAVTGALKEAVAPWLGLATGDTGPMRQKLADRPLSIPLDVATALSAPEMFGAKGSLAATLSKYGQAINPADIALRTTAKGVKLAAKLIPSAGTAEQQAANYVSNLSSRAGVSPTDIGQAPGMVMGKPITTAEAIGPTGVNAAATLARQQGQTGARVVGAMEERAAGQAPRILNDFAESADVSPEAARGNINDLVTAGRIKAAPLYKRAFDATPNTSDYLNRFAADPDIRKGMAVGIRNAQRAALKENIPFVPSAYGVTGFNEAGDPIIGAIPTWRTWDAAKNGLDQMLSQPEFRNPITKEFTKSGLEINGVRKSLITELDKLNPAYADARAAGGDYLSARTSYDLGGKHVTNPNISYREVQSEVSAMTPEQADAYKGGVANKLYELAMNNKLKPQALQTPAMKEKLSVIMGSKAKASEFLSNLRVEQEMAASGRQMMPQGGSQTYSLANEAAIQAGTPSTAAQIGNFGLDVAQHGATPAIGKYVLGKARSALDRFSASGGMSPEARDIAGSVLLSKDPKAIANLLQTMQINNIPTAAGVTTIPYNQRMMMYQLPRLQNNQGNQ